MKWVSDSVGNIYFFTSESEMPRSKDSQIILKLFQVILVISIRFRLSRRTVTTALSTDTYGLNCRNPSVLHIPGSSSPPPIDRMTYTVADLPSPASTIIRSRSPIFQSVMFCNSLNMFSACLCFVDRASRHMSVMKPTWWIVYLQFIQSLYLYMFRAC
jgi:hypothetical protein